MVQEQSASFSELREQMYIIQYAFRVTRNLQTRLSKCKHVIEIPNWDGSNTEEDTWIQTQLDESS